MTYTVSLKKMYNPDDVYTEMAKYITFPSYFKSTLEEFQDMLKLIDEDTEFIFTDTSEAECMMSRYMKNFKRIFEEACKENPKLKVEFRK